MTKETPVDEDLMQRAEPLWWAHDLERFGISKEVRTSVINHIARALQTVRDEEYHGDRGYIKVCDELREERRLHAIEKLRSKTRGDTLISMTKELDEERKCNYLTLKNT